jgi:hypothetical protein
VTLLMAAGVTLLMAAGVTLLMAAGVTLLMAAGVTLLMATGVTLLMAAGVTLFMFARTALLMAAGVTLLMTAGVALLMAARVTLLMAARMATRLTFMAAQTFPARGPIGMSFRCCQFNLSEPLFALLLRLSALPPTSANDHPPLLGLQVFKDGLFRVLGLFEFLRFILHRRLQVFCLRFNRLLNLICLFLR